MESKFQTSFIPKKSLNEGSGTRVKTPLSILFAVAVFVTVATLLVSGGLFGFTYLTNKNIESKRAELVEKEKSFDYDSMNDVVRIDKKLKTAADLVESHTAVSNLFSLLEENTLRNLRFTSFNFDYLAKDKIAVTMLGEARTFGVVAKQAEAFSSIAGNKGFSDSIFSDLNVNESGNVVFSFLTSIDPSVISYSENLSATPEVVPEPTSVPTASSTTNTQN